MITISTLQERVEAAIAALDAGNFEDAIRLADGALLQLSVIPDSTFDNNDQIRFDRIAATSALNSVIKRARQQITANAASLSVPVEYRRG